jgi:acetyl esterase
MKYNPSFESTFGSPGGSRWSRKLAQAAAAVTVFAMTSASAQNVPPEIKKQLIEQAWAQGGAAKAYEELLAKMPKEGVKITKDLAYGKHERQKLDVYEMQGKSNQPIMVFFHGGGYTGGARDNTPYVHANVLTYFAHRGFLGVNADFRLAPESTWPSGGQDVAAVVKWLQANARAHGGDPSKIYLFGTSAGASHVAQYAFDRRFQPSTGPGLAGIILQSGRYVLHSDPDDPSLQGGVQQYFGKDPDTYPSRSVINHVNESNVPVMLLMTEFDQLNLAATTGELFVALCKRDGGRCPRFVQLKYHNHGTEYHHFNTGDDYLGKEILEWISSGFGENRKFVPDPQSLSHNRQ